MPNNPARQFLNALEASTARIGGKFKLVTFAILLSAFVGGSGAFFLAGAVGNDNTRARSVLGGYLAGSMALLNSDFDTAARFLIPVYAQDKSDVTIRNQLIISYLVLNGFPKAYSLVEEALKEDRYLGELGMLLQSVKQTKRGRMKPRSTAGEDLIHDTMLGWTLARSGKIDSAVEKFDEIGENYGQAYLQNIFAGLTYAMVGDFARADTRFAKAFESTSLRRITVDMAKRHKLAYIQVLSQLERNRDALKVFNEHFIGPLDPDLKDIRNQLKAGVPLAFEATPDANALLSELYLSFSEIVRRAKGWAVALAYARAAEFVDKDNIAASMATARLIADSEQPRLALPIYERITKLDSIHKTNALLGKAEVLSALGDNDATIDILRTYNRSQPDNMFIFWSLGDYLVETKQYEEAATAYNRALEILEKFPSREMTQSYWRIYFGHGIAHERTGQWDEAEKSFRKAIALSPKESSVLNYLGYSLVERREKLNEALQMIKHALELSNHSGHITDSLAWVYYRLRRFEEAVPVMERAAELLPVDPIVNDHLGDIYWAVGREREAGYQWERALIFSPEPKEEARIRKKLAMGLDAVLIEEGAEPTRTEKSAR